LKRNSYLSLSKSIFAAILIVIAYSCSNDTVTPSGPEAKTINGNVTFVDTNFILTGGSYLISAFASSAWPPMGPPNSYDTIKITRTGNILNTSYNYKLKDLNPGDYVVTVGFRKTTGGQSPIMSVYGCDTARSQYSMCFLNPPNKATIGANNEGTQGINMLSWADTTKKVY